VSEPPRASFLGPLLHWLLLGGLLGLALLLVLTRPLATNDYGIYVAMGRQILATGSLLDRDPFTFTLHGESFQHASWGYSLLCAASHEAFGYQGIRGLIAGAVLLTLGGTWLLARRAGAGPQAAVVATLYAWLMLLQNLGPRGQTLVYPLFLVLVALLMRPPRPWLGALAGLILGWLWAQLHGSFPIAILYCGAITVGVAVSARSPRAALPGGAVGLGLLVGSMLGPYGPGLWVYVYSNGAVLRGRDVLEWYPPAPLSFAGLRLWLALALWAALLIRGRGRLPAGHWLLLLGFGAMSLTATRIIAWLGLATAVPLAQLITRAGAKGPDLPRLSGRQRLVLGGLGVLWLSLLAKGTPARIVLSPDTPVGLAERLAAEPPGGRLFAPFEASSFLAMRFFDPSATDPLGSMRHPYLLDMRTWIYPDAIWQDYMAISAAEPGWQGRLDHWEVRYLLLSHSYHGPALLPAVRSSSHWELLAEDPAGALFRRVD
jgi:hypothetical protein